MKETSILFKTRVSILRKSGQLKIWLCDYECLVQGSVQIVASILVSLYRVKPGAGRMTCHTQVNRKSSSHFLFTLMI